MNAKQELLSIYRQSNLSRRRNPSFGKNVGSRIAIGIVWLIGLVYLAFIGVLLAFLVREDKSVNAIAFISGILPFILLADFVLRLVVKPDPSQVVKPYILLPISEYAIADAFLLDDLLSPINLVWQALFIPYAVLTIFPSNGILVTIVSLLVLQLFIIIASQWFVLVHSLTITNLKWWILPVLVYGIEALPFFSGSGNSIDNFCGFYSKIGEWLSLHQFFLWSSLFVTILILLLVNRKVLRRIFRSDTTTGNNISDTSFSIHNHVNFISCRNSTNMFMKMEMASIMRNKNLRRTFVKVILFNIILCALITLTDYFTMGFMWTLWLFYSLNLFNAMFLIKIMCYEGNYIDALVINKGNIKSLLRAKYRLSLIFLLLTFIIFLPTIFSGIYTFYDVISYMLFIAGPVTFGYFMMAPYNNQTLPLNSKIAGRGATANNYTQMIMSIVLFALPLTIISFLENIFGHETTNHILAITGILFIYWAHLWIPFVADKMKKRKYINLDAFRSTSIK